MNRLKLEPYAEILRGSRAGWYEYREKIVRGYARLRAAQSNIQLERESTPFKLAAPVRLWPLAL
jgi:hypothetical protein